MSVIRAQMKEVMTSVFDTEIVPDDCTYGSYEPWDSLAQMNLIIAIEDEFSIVLSDDDVEDMLTLDLACSIVEDLLKEGGA